MANSLFTIQLAIYIFVPNFKFLSQVVAEKSLTKIVHKHYIGLRDVNQKMKNGKINVNILIFFYTIYLAILKVYTIFEDPGSNRS